VYFPVDNIISLLYVMSDGGSAEIAVVGFEGVVGIAVFMGGESTPVGPSHKAPDGHTVFPPGTSRRNSKSIPACA